MSDVPTATKMAALEEHVRQLQKAHADVACENARLTNDMGIIGNRLSIEREDHTATYRALSNARAWIDGQDVRSDFPNATAMRQALDATKVELHRRVCELVVKGNALDRERERCGVLEREIARWRSEFPLFKVQRNHIKVNAIEVGDEQPTVVEMPECDETDTRHALDAAKFVGGG
jgi:hypothetical protein